MRNRQKRQNNGSVEGVQNTTAIQNLLPRKSARAVHVVGKRAQKEEKEQAVRGGVCSGDKSQRKQAGCGGKEERLPPELDSCAEEIEGGKAEEQPDGQHATERVCCDGKCTDKQEANGDRAPGKAGV